VLDLYTRRFGAKPLRCDEHVISADEKTSIQARIRKHPNTAPAPGRPARLEHEYARGDSLAYLAAWDVHRAQVFGRCEPTTGIEAFDWLVGQVMTSQPYASARRVFWIVDNGSSHRGQPSVDRLQSRWPTLRLIHLPIHASWLNQVEIYVMHRGSARLAQPHTKGTPVSSTDYRAANFSTRHRYGWYRDPNGGYFSPLERFPPRRPPQLARRELLCPRAPPLLRSGTTMPTEASVSHTPSVSLLLEVSANLHTNHIERTEKQP
jgi:DDE superfamily endonuclease